MRIRLPPQILHMLVLQVLNLTVNIMFKTFTEGLGSGSWISSRAYVLYTNQVSALAGVPWRLAEQRKQKLVLKV